MVNITQGLKRNMDFNRNNIYFSNKCQEQNKIVTIKNEERLVRKSSWIQEKVMVLVCQPTKNPAPADLGFLKLTQPPLDLGHWKLNYKEPRQCIFNRYKFQRNMIQEKLMTLVCRPTFRPQYNFDQFNKPTNTAKRDDICDLLCSGTFGNIPTKPSASPEVEKNIPSSDRIHEARHLRSTMLIEVDLFNLSHSPGLEVKRLSRPTLSLGYSPRTESPTSSPPTLYPLTMTPALICRARRMSAEAIMSSSQAVPAITSSSLSLTESIYLQSSSMSPVVPQNWSCSVMVNIGSSTSAWGQQLIISITETIESPLQRLAINTKFTASVAGAPLHIAEPSSTRPDSGRFASLEVQLTAMVESNEDQPPPLPMGVVRRRPLYRVVTPPPAACMGAALLHNRANENGEIFLFEEDHYNYRIVGQKIQTVDCSIDILSNLHYITQTDPRTEIMNILGSGVFSSFQRNMIQEKLMTLVCRPTFRPQYNFDQFNKPTNTVERDDICDLLCSGTFGNIPTKPSASPEVEKSIPSSDRIHEVRHLRSTMLIEVDLYSLSHSPGLEVQRLTRPTLSLVYSPRTESPNSSPPSLYPVTMTPALICRARRMSAEATMSTSQAVPDITSSSLSLTESIYLQSSSMSPVVPQNWSCSVMVNIGSSTSARGQQLMISITETIESPLRRLAINTKFTASVAGAPLHIAEPSSTRPDSGRFASLEAQLTAMVESNEDQPPPLPMGVARRRPLYRVVTPPPAAFLGAALPPNRTNENGEIFLFEEDHYNYRIVGQKIQTVDCSIDILSNLHYLIQTDPTTGMMNILGSEVFSSFQRNMIQEKLMTLVCRPTFQRRQYNFDQFHKPTNTAKRDDICDLLCSGTFGNIPTKPSASPEVEKNIPSSDRIHEARHLRSTMLIEVDLFNISHSPGLEVQRLTRPTLSLVYSPRTESPTSSPPSLYPVTMTPALICRARRMSAEATKSTSQAVPAITSLSLSLTESRYLQSSSMSPVVPQNWPCSVMVNIGSSTSARGQQLMISITETIESPLRRLVINTEFTASVAGAPLHIAEPSSTRPDSGRFASLEAQLTAMVESNEDQPPPLPMGVARRRPLYRVVTPPPAACMGAALLPNRANENGEIFLFEEDRYNYRIVGQKIQTVDCSIDILSNLHYIIQTDPTTGMMNILGSGVFGSVFTATHLPSGETVALKLQHDGDERTVEVVAEARIMALLSQTRFTPKLYGLLPDPTDPRNLLIAMEMVGTGITLRKKIEENTLTERQKLSISLRLSIGLHTIHDKNVLLNDLKDDNVIVYSLNGIEFQAKFIDFGHASCGFEKRYGGNATTNARCTHLAPEVRAGEPTTASSDVYSLGFVMALFRIDKLANIVSQCMGHEPAQRPCLPTVVRNLMDLM